ncbi:MAG: STAS domain-containing protein [Amphritea sp.]
MQRQVFQKTDQRYHFDGPISYAAAKGQSSKLAACRSHDALFLNFSSVPLIDVSTVLAIEDVILDAQKVGRDVHIIGLNDIVESILKRLKILDLIPEASCYKNRRDALESAYQQLYLDKLN